MITTPIIAGNWKLHHGPRETAAFFRDFLPRLPAAIAGTVVVCPPAISITIARDALPAGSDILLGVQNVYWETKGAFTGEISAEMASDAGARVALVGHSERRHVFGESDNDTARKVRACLDAGLAPVLCVGEKFDEREGNQHEAVVERQFSAVASHLRPDDVPRLVIAYEPVWAIGTGRTATPADASEMHAHLRALLQSAFPSSGPTVPILYGGSVKPDNALDLLRAPHVDGLLIGGASLDPVGFADICTLRA